MENRSNSTVGTHARQRSRPQDIYYHIRRSSPIITLVILLFLTFSPLLKHNEPVQKNISELAASLLRSQLGLPPRIAPVSGYENGGYSETPKNTSQTRLLHQERPREFGWSE